jgi:hypothetical protein
MTKNHLSTFSITEDNFAPLSTIIVKFHLFGKRILLLAIGVCLSLLVNAQVSKTINLTTAGTLSTALIVDELNSVTNLTLTGTIDARDFKTMKDKMPSLEVLDLSGVSILQYVGFDGTSSTTSFISYPKNTVPDFAFYRKFSLRRVIVPSGITSIGASAFAVCNNLTLFDIPSSVTSIGDEAFCYCNSLTSITIPPLVTSIGYKTFDNCSNLTSIDIPSSVTSIGIRAFADCKGLTSIDIPSSVTLIGGEAFRECYALTSIIIPPSVTSIGYCAFFDCNHLTSVNFLSSSVLSIDDSAFFNCSALTSITVPATVTSIGRDAFGWCRHLTSINIQSSVTSIGSGAFSMCEMVSSIQVNSPLPINLSSSPNVFDNINKSTTILKVPSGSKSAYQAAEQWKDFTNIVEMTELVLSANSILFGQTGGTTNLSLGSSSNWSVVSDQPWLTPSPDSGEMGSSALSLTATANTDTITRTALITVTAIGFEPRSITVTQYGKVKVTAGKLKDKLAGQLATILSLTLTGTIDARDFKTMRDEMPMLEELDLSETTIVEYKGIEGPDGVYSQINPANTVPAYSFFYRWGATTKIKLRTIILPSSCSSIGKNAFRSCNYLTTVGIPPSVVSIEESAFQECKSLTSVTIPPSVESIGVSSFEYCTALTSVSIPPSVVSIGDFAYAYCSGITSLSIPSSIVTIGNGAFQLCEGLTSLNMPSSVKSIGMYAFRFCTNLTSINIPSTVTSIGGEAFYGCDKVSSIQVNTSLPINLSASPGVFLGINKTTTVLKVPYGSKTAYQSATQWKDFLNIVEATQGFYLSTTLPPLIPAEGGMSDIDVTANINWTANSNQAWLTISPSSGTGIGQKLNFTAEANPLQTTRKAVVTVSATGIESQTITITQDRQPQPPFVFELTPGGLKSELTINELDTITNLTLTGTIDARDFKTMRDNMPLLAKLDLSGVSIVSYTGKEGTSFMQNTYYPSNTIPEFAFVSGADFIGKTSLISVVLPSSITSFGQDAFENCSGLKEINIPPSVTSIESYAFYFCSRLLNVNIPAGVKNIGRNAFLGLSCPISVSSDNLNYSGSDGILFNKAQTELIQCNFSKTGEYSIPTSVVSIGMNAFDGCKGLTSVTIPSSVNSIGYVAFQSCSGLTSVTIPSSVTSIGSWAFESCSGLTSITSLRITPVDLSSSSGVFQYVDKTTCTLYVPYGSKSLYQMADQWKDFTNIVELNSGIVSNAGPDQVINEGQVVTLDGTGSKSNNNNNPLNYKWTAPAGITLSSETASNPSFIAPEVSIDTDYTFELIVNDDSVNSTADQVKVTVKQVNKAPFANAGTNQTANENSLVALDGSASSDPDRDELSYLWTAPAGISLSSVTAKNPTFTAPEVNQDNIYRFILLVNDGKTDSDTSQVSIIVKQLLPVLKLVSKTSDSQISSNEVNYQFYLKTGNSFSEESVTPVMNGDTTEFSLEPGEWIVLASPSQNPSLFVPTYSGNTLEWIKAEHIIIPEKGITFKEITCFLPEIVNKGAGQISGYVYEKADTGTKSISMAQTFEVSGNPVPGALIRLFKKGNTVPVLSIFTDAQGYYKFDQLEVLDYQIVVDIPGFTQSEKFEIAISTDQPLAAVSFEVNTTSQVITDTNELLVSSLKIYPNPVVRLVTIEVGRSNTIPYSILVYSLDGELLINQVATASGTILDLSKLVAGSYLIQVCSGAERQSSIVIKK